MFYWIDDYPPLCVAALFVFVFVAATCLAIFFFRRFFHPWVDRERRTNDMVGFAFSGFSVLYGILVGLLAVAAYQNFSAVDDIVTNESSSLEALYRDLRAYPQPIRGRLQDELRDYTRYVIDQSWPEQKKGILPAEESHRSVHCDGSCRQKAVGRVLISPRLSLEVEETANCRRTT